MDARHDYKGVAQDLCMWWPKLRRGGVMAGHDYTEQREPDAGLAYFGERAGCSPAGPIYCDPASSGQDWTLNYDGSTDRSGRVVRGAVDDFFIHTNISAPCQSPLRGCPRHVLVTYHEPSFNTWVVAK